MSVVASEISPLNCRWLAWEHGLPVCRRPSGTRHRVTESECAVCEHWAEGPPTPHAAASSAGQAQARAPHRPETQDPLNRETCPRCGSHDIVLIHRDAVVQSFTCSICHQRWLATRPWPLLRETRSRHTDPPG